MRIVRRGDDGALARALDRAAGQEPTFGGELQPRAGYSTSRRHVQVGHGPAAFRACVDGVLGWQVQRRAGLTVLAQADRAATGGTLVQGLPLGPVFLLAPCRVVHAVVDARRGGFDYATLPGHPEDGRERFLVERRSDDSAWFTVQAVSRAGSVLTRLGGPLGRLVQDRVLDRYVTAARQLAAQGVAA